MSSLPQGRAGRLTAVALLCLVLAVLWVGLAQPYLGHLADQRDERAELHTLLPRYLTVAAELPALRTAALARAAAAPGGTVPEGGRLLRGATDAAASAELLSLSRQLVTAAGGTLVTAENLPPADTQPLRRLGVRLTLDGDLDLLVRLLTAAAGAGPYLRVGELEATMLGVGTPAGEGVAPRLKLSLNLAGWRRG